MANPRTTIDALLTEHFTYTPLTLLDDIINTVNECIYVVLNSVEAGLLGASPKLLGYEQMYNENGWSLPTEIDPTTQEPIYPEKRQEIEEGVHRLETLLEARTDRNFDRFEIYVLRNLLDVQPPELVTEGWLRLRHYEDLDLEQPPTTSNSPPLNLETLHELRRKLNETRRLNTALEVESARNEALLRDLRHIVHGNPTSNVSSQEIKPETRDPSTITGDSVPTTASLAFLTEGASAQTLGLPPVPQTSMEQASKQTQGQAPLTDHTRQLISHLPALKQLLAELKPRAEALKRGEPLLKSDRSGRISVADLERREYIESRARAQLERHGMDMDIDTGNNHAVPRAAKVAGGAEGTPSSIATEQVRSIENLANALKKHQPPNT